MAVLEGGEVLRQHLRTFVFVHPADADDVRPVPQPRQLTTGTAGAFGLPDAQPEHDLAPFSHGVQLLDQFAFRHRVVTDTVSAAEGTAEHRQVQRRLVMRRGVQHGGCAHLADCGNRRVVEVRIEGHHVGIRCAHGVDELGRDGAVVVHPPAPLLQGGVARSQLHEPVEAVEIGKPASYGGVPVHGHAVDVGRTGFELVFPRVRVHGARRVHLGLPRRMAAQVFGQLARRRLRTADHLRPVTGRHKDDLPAHCGPTASAMVATIRPAAAFPESSAARRRPAAVRAARRHSSVPTRWSAAAT